MSQEKQAAPSPFAALSYQDQQDRWLEWRSRQLEFQEGAVIEAPNAYEKPAAEVPPVTLPHFQQAAPTHHKNLDQVLARHANAAKHLTAFTSSNT
ncbi:MAG: hypothetical protein IJ189_00965 [Clostridia bacterium]|nr:hypothetical protein [Clostridia bacterium]